MNLFLFHRDLRLIDNTTLIDQIKNEGNITPCFILNTEQIDKNINKYFSNNSVQFMIESLIELSKDIKNLNGELYFFEGYNLTIIKSIHKTNKINSIGFNLDYTPFARIRDKEIINFCNDNNIKVYCKEDYLLYDILNDQTKKKDNTPYLVFTAFKNHCYKNLKVRQIDKFHNFEFKKYNELKKIKYFINQKDTKKFYIENNNINVRGGRLNGLKIINNLEKFKDYKKCRDYLTYNTTFLSAYTHFTPISIREIYHNIHNNPNLIMELHWRDFYVNVTWNYPHVLKGQAFKHQYNNIKWTDNKILFDKFKKGETGFPVIDAGIRQLLQTGYVHNRVRMLHGCFLTKNLHINWTRGEKFYAQHLVDYSPMQNNGGWQWCASTGTDAQPYFRIFNPWTQTEKYDKECEYIKKWIPELINVPNKDLLKWNETWEKYIHTVNYHKPIIDYKNTRTETLILYKKI